MTNQEPRTSVMELSRSHTKTQATTERDYLKVLDAIVDFESLQKQTAVDERSMAKRSKAVMDAMNELGIEVKTLGVRTDAEQAKIDAIDREASNATAKVFDLEAEFRNSSDSLWAKLFGNTRAEIQEEVSKAKAKLTKLNELYTTTVESINADVDYRLDNPEMQTTLTNTENQVIALIDLHSQEIVKNVKALEEIQVLTKTTNAEHVSLQDKFTTTKSKIGDLVVKVEKLRGRREMVQDKTERAKMMNDINGLNQSIDAANKELNRFTDLLENSKASKIKLGIITANITELLEAQKLRKEKAEANLKIDLMQYAQTIRSKRQAAQIKVSAELDKHLNELSMEVATEMSGATKAVANDGLDMLERAVDQTRKLAGIHIATKNNVKSTQAKMDELSKKALSDDYEI